MLEKPDLIASVLEVIDIEMFGSYAPLFNEILNGKHEDSRLMRILVDESIQVMSEEELQMFLRTFMMRHYDKELKRIVVDQNIPFAKKSFLIRKIKTDIIPRLKRGELVSYDKDLFA